MRVANSEEIAAVLNTMTCERPAGVRRRRAVSVPPPVTRNRKRRCQCGHCRECADNARWERIFAEKFADPDYYTRPVVHAASPLVSI
jgi:hypothetical protein